MSHSIFSSALGRAIHRRPPSAPLLLRLNSTLLLLHHRHHHGPRPRQSSPAAPNTAATTTPIDTTTTTPTTATPTSTTTTNYTTTSATDPPWPPRQRNPPEHADACHRRPKTLLALLHLLDRAHDVPSRPSSVKADLTFHDALARGARRRTQPQQTTDWRLRKGPIWSRGWLGSVSLKSITYEYMYHFLLQGRDLGDVEAVERVFGGRVVGYLRERGYAVEHVVVWAWILMARDERQAALRIDVWARLGGAVGAEGGGEGLRDAIKEIIDCDSFNPLDAGGGGPPPQAQTQAITRPYRIPPFILLHNLRRPHTRISAPTLRQLLPHVQQALLSPRSGDTKTPLLLLIRLLRHARSSWPPAIPHVADLMTQLHPASPRPPRPSARLTATYNRLLALLSLPPSDRPFQCMPLLQHSQFTLLRKMATLDIPITREGYRALIAVQLAHPKTPAEAQHVNSLSTNWPPWPVPKDGHRHSPGHASSAPHLSRAAQVLQQMAAAGYHNLGWEKEAAVLAGTDTDSSPTIQTRTFHHAGRAGTRKDPLNIWAVRIRATRTLDEAWCVFLECMAAVAVPPPPAWEELFYKVCSARRVGRLLEGHQRRLQAIKAAHDAAGPPTRETLQAVEQWGVVDADMAERAKRVLPGDAREVAGVGAASPSERVYVPVKAPTVEELFDMMRRVCGKRARVSVRLLAYLVREAETLEQGERLLTTWSAERFRRLLKTSPPTGTRSDDWPILTSYLTLLLRAPTPPRLSLSLRLLQSHTPRHPPAWNAVLAALSTTPTAPLAASSIAAARLALVWRLHTTMAAHRIQADSNTLRLLCVAAARCPAGLAWGGQDPVDAAAGVVERAFGIGGGGGEGVPLLAAEAAALHAYVRMLGFAGRRERLEVLVGWVRGRVDVGSVAGRRVVVACAVFGVEGGGEGGEWPGGWPGEEEVERYVVRGWRGVVERGESEVEEVEGAKEVKDEERVEGVEV